MHRDTIFAVNIISVFIGYAHQNIKPRYSHFELHCHSMWIQQENEGKKPLQIQNHFECLFVYGRHFIQCVCAIFEQSKPDECMSVYGFIEWVFAFVFGVCFWNSNTLWIPSQLTFQRFSPFMFLLKYSLNSVRRRIVSHTFSLE